MFNPTHQNKPPENKHPGGSPITGKHVYPVKPRPPKRKQPQQHPTEGGLAANYWEQFGATNQFHAILIANEAKKNLAK